MQGLLACHIMQLLSKLMYSSTNIYFIIYLFYCKYFWSAILVKERVKDVIKDYSGKNEISCSALKLNTSTQHSSSFKEKHEIYTIM